MRPHHSPLWTNDHRIPLIRVVRPTRRFAHSWTLAREDKMVVIDGNTPPSMRLDHPKHTAAHSQPQLTLL